MITIYLSAEVYSTLRIRFQYLKIFKRVDQRRYRDSTRTFKAKLFPDRQVIPS